MEYTEVLDKQITRKQHYVPKAYLKNFSVSNQNQNKFMLFLLMMKMQKWFQSTIFAVVLTYMIKLQFMSSLLFRNPVFVHLSNYIIDTQYKNDLQHIKHVKDMFPDVPQNVYLSMLANEFLKINIAPDVGLFPRDLAETMKESQLCIFKAKGSVFVTSDMK